MKPGLHALIIGISAYPNLPNNAEPLKPHHFKMRKLSSAALTAFKIYRWLREQRKHPEVPLASSRLLLLPSQEELDAEPELNNFKQPCTLNDLQKVAEDWRKDSSSHRDNVTFFYFAGHGIQRFRGDHVLLLAGFGKKVGPALGDSAVTSNLIDGMAPSITQPDIARTQLYFIDSCRITPSKIKEKELMNAGMNAGTIWDVDVQNMIDDRIAPIFYTTVPGTRAFGIKGNQTIFSKAFLECLNGGAAVKLSEDRQGKLVWGVSISSISAKLKHYVDKINKENGANQRIFFSGVGAEVILHYLDEPPLVDVMLEIDPETARKVTTVKVLNNESKSVWDLSAPLNPHPYYGKLLGGFYIAKAEINSFIQLDITPQEKIFFVEPPFFALKIIMGR